MSNTMYATSYNQDDQDNLFGATNFVLFNCNPDPPEDNGMFVGGNWPARVQDHFDIKWVGLYDGVEGWDLVVNHKNGVVDAGTMAFIFRCGASEGRRYGHIAGAELVTGRPRPVQEPTGVTEYYAPGIVYSFPEQYWIDVETLRRDPNRPRLAPFHGPPLFRGGMKLPDADAAWLISYMHPDLRANLSALARQAWTDDEDE